MNTSGPGAATVARIWFIDVGAGDCTLVIDESTKRAIVVDCPTWHVQQVKSLLAEEHAILDTVIVTHWDLDHYGGASRLAVGFPVRKVFYNHDTLFPDGDSPKNLIKTALKNFLNIPLAQEVLRPAEVGQSGGFGSVNWQILAPTHYEVTKAYLQSKKNVASAVIDIKVENLRILIGGDAVGETWARLLADTDLHSDILRWPHHGADLAGDRDGSIRDNVLASVQPKYVIVSTGSKNRHGHPSGLVVEAAASNFTVLCTQVTPGCFGFRTKSDRETSMAQTTVQGLEKPHCASTVCVECHSSSYSVSPSPTEHESRIILWPEPLCRRF
jgi:competence protein ComEC